MSAMLEWQILNSEALQSHFQENPQEFQVKKNAEQGVGWLMLITCHFFGFPAWVQVLRHDKGILPSNRIQGHLKHVPDYLLPQVTKPSHYKGNS